MTLLSLKDYTDSIFRLLKPFKRSLATSPSVDYMDGWNDCIKQMKENKRRYIEGGLVELVNKGEVTLKNKVN